MLVWGGWRSSVRRRRGRHGYVGAGLVVYLASWAHTVRPMTGCRFARSSAVLSVAAGGGNRSRAASVVSNGSGSGSD